MADSFRMEMTPSREEALEAAKQTFNENTKSKAVVLACEHSRLDAAAKEDALRRLADKLDLGTLLEVADDLSTSTMPIEVDVDVVDDHAEIEVRVGRGEVENPD